MTFCWRYMKYTDRAIEGMMMIDVLTSQIDLNILIEPFCLVNFNATQEINKGKTNYQ